MCYYMVRQPPPRPGPPRLLLRLISARSLRDWCGLISDSSGHALNRADTHCIHPASLFSAGAMVCDGARIIMLWLDQTIV